MTKEPVDNFSAKPARRRAGSPRIEQLRLFDLPPYRRERSSMNERLAIFRANYVQGHPAADEAQIQKAVDNARIILDRVRRLQA